MIKNMMMSILVCAFATSALAQTKPAAKQVVKPALAQAQNDTLTMSCSDITKLVNSKPEGVVLKTGSNRWDLYVHDSEACQKISAHESSPALVRSKDSRACFIGYTCEDKIDLD